VLMRSDPLDVATAVTIGRGTVRKMKQNLGWAIGYNSLALPIAAVMLDLGFSADVVKSVPILARTAGLLAHLAEERANPVGFLMAGKAEEAIAYEPTPPPAE